MVTVGTNLNLSVLPDHIIRSLVESGELIISPFIDHTVRTDENGNKVLSYGLSSYGYDFRLGTKFYFPKYYHESSTAYTWDFWNFQEENILISVEREKLIIPPKGWCLASSYEKFKLPPYLFAFIFPKSSILRMGLMVNFAPIEPSWEGHLTFPIFNPTPYRIVLYPLQGFAQICFFMSVPPQFDYNDRQGYYQNQPDEPTVKPIPFQK